MAALEQEKAEFIKFKQQLEAEFNQKRAKFKELYLSKEGRRPRWDPYAFILMNGEGGSHHMKTFCCCPPPPSISPPYHHHQRS